MGVRVLKEPGNEIGHASLMRTKLPKKGNETGRNGLQTGIGKEGNRLTNYD